MHVRTSKHPSDPIVDLSANLPSCFYKSCKVYGHSRVEEFERLTAPTPNIEVLFNADNYAWWCTAAFFAKLWGFTPSKARMTVRDDTPPEGWTIGDNDGPEVDAGSFTIPDPVTDGVDCTVDASGTVKCPDQGNFETASNALTNFVWPDTAPSDPGPTSSAVSVPATTTPPNTAPTTAGAAPTIPPKVCDIDCGSELHPGTPVKCRCSCKGRPNFLITNKTPDCPPKN